MFEFETYNTFPDKLFIAPNMVIKDILELYYQKYAIINNNSILRTFYINLFTDLKIKLEENEIQYNTDMYEELVPLKYSIIKKDNNIYLNSVEISL